eukprot:Nk52_evm21s266 gene=Nk52_evmTU21s266
MTDAFINCTILVKLKSGTCYQGVVSRVDTSTQSIVLAEPILDPLSPGPKSVFAAELSVKGVDILDLQLVSRPGSASAGAMPQPDRVNSAQMNYASRLKGNTGNSNLSNNNPPPPPAPHFSSPVPKMQHPPHVLQNNHAILSSSNMTNPPPPPLPAPDGLMMGSPQAPERSSRSSRRKDKDRGGRGGKNNNGNNGGNQFVDDEDIDFGLYQCRTVEPHNYTVQSPNLNVSRQQQRNGKKEKYKSQRDQDAFGHTLSESVLDDFDFEGNLKRFDKAQVFAEIQENEKTRPEERLVHINKKPQNFEYYENVLDSEEHDGPKPVLLVPGAVSPSPSNSSSKPVLKTDNDVVVPYLSSKQRANLFTICEKIQITKEIMAENGGRSVCELGLHLLGGSRRINAKNLHQLPVIVVLCSDSFMGNIGMVAARHFASHNTKVILFNTTASSSLSERSLALTKLFLCTDGTLVSSCKVEELPRTRIDAPVDLIIDALGTSERGFVDTANADVDVSQLIDWANNDIAPKLSIDFPSFSGTSSVESKCTVGLGLPQDYNADSNAGQGQLIVLDMGIPAKVCKRVCGESYFPFFGDKFTAALHVVHQ